MRIFLLIIVVAVHLLYADSATQTDWSGGPGVMGPVTDWGNQFYIGSDLDWDTTPGQLCLIIDIGENPIAGSVLGAIHIFTIDMDNDGDEDIVGAAKNSDKVCWWENSSGTGRNWPEHLIGNVNDPIFVYPADLDLDGDRDVIVSSSGDDVIYWYENTGSGSGWNKYVLTNGFDARQIVCADLNYDNYEDIIGVSSASGDVCWWQNRLATGQQWVQHYIDGALMGAYAVCAADFNFDAKTDVVVASYSGNSVYYYQRAGTGWMKQPLDTSLGGAISVSVGDVDTDGRPDVLAVGYTSDDVVWYDFSDTQAAWFKYTVSDNFNGAISVISADVDADGYEDIVTAGRESNDVAWWKNINGQGNNWEFHLIDSNFSGARCVSTGDIDGNGAVDVVACAEYGNEISWWNITGFSTPGTCTSSIYDTGPGNNYWHSIFFSFLQPSGTSVKFQIRASNDHTVMGPWSSYIEDPGSLVGILQDNDRYMQYMATLETTNPVATPGLKDVTILWTVTSIEDLMEPVGNQDMLRVIGGNPVNGAFSIAYLVENAGPVELTIYDMSGRVVRELASGYMEPGSYMVSVSDLPTGTYACALQIPGSWVIEKLVILP